MKRLSQFLGAALLAQLLCFSTTGRAQGVGIGTTTPTAKLEVNGDFKVGTTTGSTAAQISQTVGPLELSNSTFGQSFVLPTAGTITSLTIYTQNRSVSGSGYFYIYAGTGFGSPLLMQPVPAPSLSLEESAFTVSPTTPLALAAGTYTFVFNFLGVQTNHLVAGSDAYADGAYYGASGFNPNRDLKFQLSYTPTPGNSLALYAATNGNVGIGTMSPACKLDVNGAIRCVGAVNTTSDARLKQRIRPLGDALAQVQALRGVRYTFRQAEFPQLNLPAGEQLGLLAQEVEAVFPELVSTDAQGYKAVNYAQLAPVLIEALKEQQRRLDQQQAAWQSDHADLQTLKGQLARLLAESAPASTAPDR